MNLIEPTRASGESEVEEPARKEEVAGHIATAVAKGDFDAALKLCDEALAQRPSPVLVRRRAQLLQSVGRAREARDILASLRSDRPDDIGIAVDLAATEMALGDLAEAERLYGEVLVADPLREAALIGLINVAAARGDVDAALKLCDEALAQRPSPVLVRRRAQVLQSAGRAREARDILSSLRNERPDDLGIAVELAAAEMALGDLAEAERLFDAVLASDPLWEAALIGRINVAAARGDVDAALKLCDEALAQRPSPVLVRRRAQLLQSVGRAREARDILTSLRIERPDDLAIAVDLAAAAMALGDLAEAERLFGAVLASDPLREAALIGRINVAAARGDVDAALRLCDEALAVRPSPVLVRRQAQVLQSAGRAREARDILASLRRDRPDDIGIAVELAAAQMMLGDLAEAERLFGAVLVADPLREPALIGRINVAAARGDVDVALKLCDEALAVRPSPVLVRRRAQVLQSAGRAREARDILASLRRDRPDDLGVAVDLATTEMALGDLAEAERLYREILASDPLREPALIGRINVAAARGDVDAALQLCDEALAQRPSPVVVRRRAQVLQSAGRAREARDILASLRRDRPDDIAIAVDLAATEMALGDLAEAERLYGEVLAASPSNWAALRAYSTHLEATGQIDKAVDLLEMASISDAGGIDRSAPNFPVPQAWSPSHTLLLLGLHFKVGDTPKIDVSLASLSGTLHILTDDQLVDFMRLAERAHRIDVVVEIIQEAMRRPGVKPQLAIGILRYAHAADRPKLAGDLAVLLADRIPAGLQQRFLSDATKMRRGPVFALAQARATRASGRSPREAAELAQLLIAGGRSRLAVRYLRLCARRWPSAQVIYTALISAFIGSGDLEGARTWIESRADVVAPQELEKMRLQVHLNEGALATALATMKAQVERGQRPGSDPALIQVLAAIGRLEEAEATAEAMRRDPRRPRHEAAHFQVGHIGALLNELRIYRIAAAALPSEVARTSLADVHFHAAREVLDEWVSAKPASIVTTGSNTVPRRIFQYWDDPNPAQEIAEIMESWQGIPGWQYQRFDRREAIAWLRDTLGSEYAQAFRLARNPTEESDFLRLCLLLSHGGIYADADDLLIGHPDDIVAEGRGLVLFREPFGAIANNLICAPPRHPVIGSAAAMAKDALLRRDNDSPWSKTGPGLLTRATARWILDDPESTVLDLTVVPQSRMRRHIHPHVDVSYKGTARYWNARTRKTERGVIQALEEFVEAVREEAAPERTAFNQRRAAG